MTPLLKPKKRPKDIAREMNTIHPLSLNFQYQPSTSHFSSLWNHSEGLLR